MAPLEPFSGGLVNAGDPSLLKEGELQLTNDCTYRPHSQALWSASGRTLYAEGTALTDPYGMQYCGFDGKDDDGADWPSVLLVQTETKLWTAPAEETGTLTEITEGAGWGPLETPISPLQAVQYGNEHFLFDGANRKVLLKNGTLRSHGLLPVTNSPVVTLTPTGGVWPVGNVPVNSVVEYWTTEVYKYDDAANGMHDYIESTYAGETKYLATVKILADVNYVTIVRPPPRNVNTTHWCLYRSIPRPEDNPDLVMFPTGYQIAKDIPILTASVNDGYAVSTSSSPPSAVGDGNEFIDADHAYSAGYATKIYYWAAAEFPPHHHNLDLKGFSFGTVYDPIVKFTIKVTGHTDASGLGYVEVWGNGGNGWVKGGTGQHLPQTNDATLIFDTTFDHSISAADATSADFQIRCICSCFVPTVAPATVEIDSVTVDIEHSAVSTEIINVFPAVTVEENGLSVGRGRNGQPPLATTGDILQDRLLLNDISDVNKIRYSTPGQLDYFAEQYWLPCDTKDKDEVKCIRTLGNIGIVGLKNKLFRVMFLPCETDGVFSRGDALECFSMERGIVNSRAACTFQMEGQPMMLACVDSQGIYMTDGYKVYTLTDDIAWTDMVDVTQLDTCELVCNPTEYKLTFYYNPVSA